MKPAFYRSLAPATCLAACLALAACQPSGGPAPSGGVPQLPQPSSGGSVLPSGGPFAYAASCPARDLAALVGKPESTARGITYQGPVRIIHPGDAVTKDYIATRLNVDIDAGGRIARLSCG